MMSVQIAFGIPRFGPIGLILGQIFGQGSGFEIIRRRAIRQNRVLFRSVSRNGIRSVASSYSDFPKYSTMAALMGAAITNLPLLFFAIVYGTTVVGWYTLVVGTLLVPMSLMSVSIAQAYFGELAYLKQSAPQHLSLIHI